MEKDIQKQMATSRKGMGDYTRLILAFYASLLLLGIYQQISLYSEGILDSFSGINLIILAAQHLGFTALLSLFLYFTFNALEALKPRLGLYVTGVVLTGCLLVEGILTVFFVTRFEMPGTNLAAVLELTKTSSSLILPVVSVCVALGLCFYGLYKLSAPMQLWMGRVYPFTLAVFSLFLATLLAQTAPLTANKTKYALVDWYQKTIPLQSSGKDNTPYAISPDPLEEIYRLEETQVWQGYRNEGGTLIHPGAISGMAHGAGYITDPFSGHPNGYLPYPKAEKRELLRIQSTFRGRDYDRAFELARDLAHEGEYHKAIELCQYILSEVPSHVDAEILLGRILAWEGEFSKSAGILEQVIRKYPHYEDAYAALLDTYYWGGDFKRSIALKSHIDRHFKENKVLQQKLHRAEQMKQESRAEPELGLSLDPVNLPVS